jgi:RND superfamily putative drug exporter
VAAIVLTTLGVIGTDVESKLNPTTLEIPNTDASRANAILDEHFGDSAPFAILLRGPAAELDEQGPELIRALRRDPRVTTLSPWDRGSVDRLRPTPRKALILADFHVTVKEAVNETVPHVERTLEEEIHAPVRATQSSFATLSRAIQVESIHASERSELIALPFLLIVLLLVFRSPIAAVIPLAFGFLTVVASRGILYFLTSWFDIDAFALTVCTMMGLAVGVDYALLMVSRFREEMQEGADPLTAAQTTRTTAGRTTIFAGSTLMISMVVAMFIVPGPLLASLAGTVVMVVILSVTVATVIGPALLVLVGSNLDRWRVGKDPGSNSRLMVFVRSALKRPVLASVVIGGIVLALAGPAIALKTGPPSPEQLPQDAPARQDAELINRTIGPGYDAPFQVVALNKEGAITDKPTLEALTRFQDRIAQLPGVQLVIGPGEIAERTAPLQNFGNALFAADGDIGPVKQLGTLGRNLGVAAGGVGELRSGISEASDGAGLLAQGSDRAAEGAGMIARGLGRAASGSQRAIGGLDRFAKSSKRLSDAQEKAAVGALQLKFGAHDIGGANLRFNGLIPAQKVEKSLKSEVGSTLPRLLAQSKAVEDQLKTAFAQLQGMTVGKGDPNYGAALDAVRKATTATSGTDPVGGAPYAEGYAGIPAELEAQSARLAEDLEDSEDVTDWAQSTLASLKQLSTQAGRLSDGMRRIAAGGKQLTAGAERLAKATRSLDSGLTRLAGGATSLVSGIKQLTGGSEALETALAEGFEQSAPLQSGLDRASVRVTDSRTRVRNQVRQVKEGTPGLFDSGFFVLSQLDGAPPKEREEAGTTIDLRSGQAASMLVISKYSFNSPGSIALNKVLRDEADELGEEAGLTTGVAGGAAQLNDYSKVTRAKLPMLVAAITLVTFLVLIAVLRAIPLAALAVGLNLATVGVAFGVLTLLFEVPADLPLGGRNYVDAVGTMMIFGIIFGLSIDYAVFLLTRMREHYDENGDNAAAIEFGLEKTARVITGAAAIMMAVFIAYAGAPIATVSQLGIGLTIAVILDATVVRIVLLPALMLLMGDRVWWIPKSLDRVLPRFDV